MEKQQQIKIQFLGHNSILISDDQVTFLFDPNFSKKLFLLKRLDEPIIDNERLSQVNAVLISNAHHNRLHPGSFKYLKQKAQMILPIGLSQYVNTYFSFRVTELKEKAQTQIGSWHIMAIPSLHKGFRNCSFQSSCSLNYILKKNDKTFFYCSDTKYDGSYFFDISKEYQIDLAILPVDHVSPDFISGKRYMNVVQAIQAVQDLGAKKLLPVSFGSFNFNGRKADKITKRLKKEAEKANVSERLIMLKPSEFISL